MKRTLALAGITTVLVGLGVAVAQTQQGPGGQRGQRGPRQGHRHRPPGPGPIIMLIDADKDRSLSAEEIAGASEAILKLDKNGDGVVDQSELRPPPPPPGPNFVERIMRHDEDRDGKLTATELLPPHQKKLLEEGDTNGDGGVDATEIQAFIDSLPEPPAGGPRGRCPMGPPPGAQLDGEGQ